MVPAAGARAGRRALGVPVGSDHIEPGGIEARGWGLRYPGRRVWAVRGLDLAIRPGEHVLLLGRSGGGKSSLLTAIAGLHESSTGGTEEGRLRVGGRDPREGSRDVGIVMQDPEAQIVMARSGDDVALGLEERCVPTAEIWPRVERALADVAFPYERDHRTDALSGGEKQRLALAAVLALRPRILLLDEPTADLDPEGAAAFYDALGRIDRDTTIVLVEHRVAQALPLIDRVVALDGERGIVADGEPDHVFGDRSADLNALGAWLPDEEPLVMRGSGTGSPLLLGRELSFRYPGQPHDALPATSVDVRAGEALAIVGRNGSGKSTLLMLLGGLLRPSSGSARATRPGPEGSELWRWPARALAARVGTVFQDPDHQFVATRVAADVLAGPRAIGLPERDAVPRAAALLERLGLGYVADANPYTLSGGEKRRLGLAGVLACRPDVLLLDEPTYGQDRRTFLEVARILDEERAEGTAIGFATHDPELVRTLADRTYALAA